MAQRVLPFQYGVEERPGGMTALAGLPLYLEFPHLMGLHRLISDHVRARQADHGWSDDQMIMALVLLNLAGGDCVDDLPVIEGDEGFCRLFRELKFYGRTRSERRGQPDRGARNEPGHEPLPLRCESTWSFSTSRSKKSSGKSMRRSFVSIPGS